jgi:hypothetical protein
MTTVPPPPEIIASRYRVIRELGRGGMGVVYVVEHIHTGDHLALKLLLGKADQDAQAVERFKREARASARIKSDHVVKVVDADVAPELGGAPFLVMELLNGMDLEQRLETQGRMTPTEALHFLTEAGNALDRSHAVNIVHRDLKPENLFLHTRGDGSTVLKILDFGISKVVGGDMGADLASAGATRTGAVMGTPLYMSPEQARGRIAEIGPATDVWAMGLIATQLLSGEIYWRANTVGELMAQIIAEPLYRPSERWPWIPPAVDAWFARSCARDPKERFARVGEQMDALGVALGLRAGAGPQAREPAASMPGIAPAGATASGPVLVGAHTTTGAISREGAAPPAGKGRGLIVVGAVALCAVVGGAFFVYPRVHGSVDAPVSAVAATTATTVAPAEQATAAAAEPSAPSTGSAPGAAPAPDGGHLAAPASAPVATTAPATPAVQRNHGGSHTASHAAGAAATTVTATPARPAARTPARYDPASP